MNMKKIVAVALISGITAGSIAMANEHGATAGDDHAAAGKAACKGKGGCKGKGACKGKKKGHKNACKGKEGCKGADENKDAAHEEPSGH